MKLFDSKQKKLGFAVASAMGVLVLSSICIWRCKKSDSPSPQGLYAPASVDPSSSSVSTSPSNVSTSPSNKQPEASKSFWGWMTSPKKTDFSDSSISSNNSKGTPQGPGDPSQNSMGGVGVALPSTGSAVPGAAGTGGLTTPAGTGTASLTPGMPGADAPSVPEGPKCFTLTYRHKETDAHTGDEVCSQHKNIIRLKHEGVNLKTLCVRIGKTPVPFQTVKGKPKEILVSAIAGPNSVISARYCTGAATCNEECKIPKDEFMEAIGGTEADTKDLKIAQWDPNDPEQNNGITAKLDSDLKKELGDLDEGPSKISHVFRDWVSGPESPACGLKHASN